MNNRIDFKIFENADEKCNLNEDNINEDEVVIKCSFLLRIAVSLQYHQLLSSFTDNKESISRDVFIEFMTNTYNTFLNDYIHLIYNHSSHIFYISNDLLKHYKFKQCEINKCKFTQRRYKNRDRNYDKNDYRQPHNFHIDLFDSIHFYMAHLNDTGLRIAKNIYKNEKKERISNNNKHLDCMDYEFKEMTKQIKLKQKECGLNVGRLNHNNNSKFTISTIKTQQNIPNKALNENEDTFIDYMFYQMNKFIQDVKEKKHFFTTLSIFFEEEEYDTDVLFEDINASGVESNIFYEFIDYKQYIDCIYSLIKYYNLTTVQFSTGITFWYWKWYKNINDQQYNEEQGKVYGGEHDLSGYSITDLFVVPHYKTLKIEVLDSGYIHIDEFNEFVVQKGDCYYESQAIKQTTCKEEDDPLHYDIECGNKLERSHLYSLILYCDFTQYSKDFSSSFRSLKWSDSIKQIKGRNSTYYHTAKQLRELIQYYGVRGCGDYDEEIGKQINIAVGPFFTGMSVTLNMESFAIRLNAPTSTSKQIEVATRFAGRTGIVIELGNNFGGNERFFNCSWISAYPEEDERVFCGGRWQLEIKSIRIIETCKNYEKFFTPLSKFDATLSGKGAEFTKKHISVLSLCIKSLKTKENELLDSYISDTFYLYTKQKKQITLNLHFIHAVMDGVKAFADLIDINCLKIDDKQNDMADDDEYRAFSDYHAIDNNELDLKKDQLYKITQKGSFGWWYAINANGEDGWVPSNYLIKISKSNKEENTDIVINDIELFKSSSLWNIFENINKLVIYSTGNSSFSNGDISYTFSVLSLLWMFEKCKSLKTIIIKGQHMYGYDWDKQKEKFLRSSWLCEINLPALTKQCCAKNVKVQKKTVKSDSNRDLLKEDWLIFSV